MTPNLTFTFATSTLEAAINQEVSKIAARTVSPEGAILYDAIRITKSDKPLIEGYIGDRAHTIGAKFADCCSVSFASPSWSIGFYVPDFNTSNSGELESALKRYIVIGAVANWLATREPNTYKYFSSLAEELLNEVSASVRERTMPTPPQS